MLQPPIPVHGKMWPSSVPMEKGPEHEYLPHFSASHFSLPFVFVYFESKITLGCSHCLSSSGYSDWAVIFSSSTNPVPSASHLLGILGKYLFFQGGYRPFVF